MFNTGELLAHTFDCVARAQDLDFAGWAGAVTTVLSVMHFPHSHVMANGKPFDEAGLRKAMASAAAATGRINAGTWQTYVGGMFKAARKLADNATGTALPSFHALPKMSSEDACANVEMWLRALGMETGKHILAWSKQDGFSAYDPDAAKKAREAKAQAEGSLNLSLLAAVRSDAPLPEVAAPAAAPAPVDPMVAVMAALSALKTEAELAAVLATLNDRLTALRAAPEVVAPVLRDDALVDAKSALAAHFGKAA